MIRSGSLPFLVIIFIGGVLVTPAHALADAASDIRAQIDAHNQQLKALEAEIATYQKQLNTLSTQKNTLQSTINALALSQKQLAAKIKVTQTNIAWANKQISELSLSIGDKEDAITANKDAIGKALRIVAQNEQESVVTQLISTDSLSDAWQVADEAVQFNRALGDNIFTLKSAKITLTTNRDKVSDEKAKLVTFQNELAVQNKSIEVSRLAQQKLLADTKNQEGNYQKLLAQKRAQQTTFEKQLFQYEAQLRQALDPSAIPGARSGVLLYPVAQPLVTQFFGKTVDALRLYVSGTHGGIDFAARIGTPIKASLSGVVTDTEAVRTKNGCQYGKWVLLKHANGLSTIYGHLSHVYVQPGTTVTSGQIIGLSGDTGYATGPHLHFGVYATAGIRIVDAGALGSGGCAGIKTVAASPNAYLNPMSYL